MEAEIRDRLNEYSVSEIKKMMRVHNLHQYMKLTQKKEGLINSIVEHLRLKGHILTPKPTDGVNISDYTTMKDKPKKPRATPVKKSPVADDKKDRTDALIQSLKDIIAKKSATDKAVNDAKEGVMLLKVAKTDKTNRTNALITALNDIKSKKSATDKVVREAKDEIALLKDKRADDEDTMEVREITQDGVVYLVDEETGDVFDEKENIMKNLTWNEEDGIHSRPKKEKELKLKSKKYRGEKYLVDMSTGKVYDEDRKIIKNLVYEPISDEFKELDEDGDEEHSSSSEDEIKVTEVVQGGITFLVDKETGKVYHFDDDKEIPKLRWSEKKGVYIW